MGNGRPTLKFLYEGRLYKIAELAEMAGCTSYAMRARLKKMEPEDAVAMGPNPKVSLSRYEYLGHRYTASELAEIAGCSDHAMYVRLSKMEPADAVRMGKESTHRNYGESQFFDYKGYTLTASEIAAAEKISVKKLNEALDRCRTMDEAIKEARK